SFRQISSPARWLILWLARGCRHGPSSCISSACDFSHLTFDRPVCPVTFSVAAGYTTRLAGRPVFASHAWSPLAVHTFLLSARLIPPIPSGLPAVVGAIPCESYQRSRASTSMFCRGIPRHLSP